MELVIHSGKFNLTFNLLCQICFGFKRDIASLTKGIPQAVAASIRAPARVASLRRVALLPDKTAEYKASIVGDF